MLVFDGGNSVGSGKAPGGAILLLIAGAVLLGACDDGRVFKEQSRRGQTAKLVVPDSLTPPVRVEAVAGAPASWKLHERVAEALRNRDIPAGVRVRGRRVYVLHGRVLRTGGADQRSQVTVKWRLLDGDGRQVGEVTQLAAIPRDPSGKAKDGSDDVTQAMADAAAESLSPIVPSSRLRTSQQAMTGLPATRVRPAVEKGNPVTAIGKSAKKQTRLARALLRPGRNGAADRSAAADGAASAKTALGRRGAGNGALSRNLFRNSTGSLTRPVKPAGKPLRKPVSSRRGGAGVRVSVTTSSARRSDVPPSAGGPAPGSMEELIRRHPTRTEREAGIVARKPTPATTRQRKAVKTRPARRTRSIAVRPTSRRGPSRKVDNRAARAPRRPFAGSVAAGSPVFWVQIGSYRSRPVAERQWQVTRRAGGQTLRDANRRIMRAKVGARGIFYRVQIGPFTKRLAAFAVCRDLRGRGIDCFLFPDVQHAALPVTRAGGAPAKAAKPPVSRSPLRPSARPPGDTAVRTGARDKPPPASPSGVRKAPTATPKTPPRGPSRPGPKPDVKKPDPKQDAKKVAKAAKPDKAAAGKAVPAKKPDTRPDTEKPRPDRDPISTSPGLPGLKD